MIDLNTSRVHDKKDKIIAVCITEFATRGYDKCSTSLIAEKAGVSKALVFHHFGNKQKLYWSVVNHAIVYYSKEIEENVNIVPGDIIHNLKETAFLKARMNYRYPLMTEFIMKCFKEERRIVGKRFIEENYEYAKQMYESVYGNINLEMFKQDSNIKMAIKVVSNAFDGYTYNYVYSHIHENIQYNWSKIANELEDMATYFRGLYYKQHYHSYNRGKSKSFTRL